MLFLRAWIILSWRSWLTASSSQDLGAPTTCQSPPEFRRPEGEGGPASSSLGKLPRDILNQSSASYLQCCGSGSGIRDLVPFWPLDSGSRIRNRFFSDPPRSRIANPYFWELSDNILGKKFYNSLKIGPNFFFSISKIKYFSTSGFWQRVRARALRAAVFLGSLPSKRGAARPPPRPSQLCCFLFYSRK